MQHPQQDPNGPQQYYPGYGAQPPQYPPYPPQAFVQPPAPKPKRRRLGLKIVGGVGAGIVLIALVNGGGGSDPAPGATAQADPLSTSSAPVPAAPALAETPQTGLVPAGRTVDVGDGLQVTAEPLKSTKQSFGEPLLCTNVSFVNGTGDRVSVHPWEWKLQDPNGAAVMSTIALDGKDTFTGAELAEGGKGGGRICFDDPGMKGSYQLIYDGWFQGEEQAWETARG